MREKMAPKWRALARGADRLAVRAAGGGVGVKRRLAALLHVPPAHRALVLVREHVTVQHAAPANVEQRAHDARAGRGNTVVEVALDVVTATTRRNNLHIYFCKKKVCGWNWNWNN